MNVIFNYKKFYTDLNNKRSQRGIAWHKVGTRAGLPNSIIHRFVKQYEDAEFEGQPRGLGLDVVVSLMHWMGQYDLKRYMADEDGKPITE